MGGFMTDETFKRAKSIIKADLKRHGVKNRGLEEALATTILLIGQDAYREGEREGKRLAIACITHEMEMLVRNNV
jgi:hypothetical protein